MKPLLTPANAADAASLEMQDRIEAESRQLAWEQMRAASQPHRSAKHSPEPTTLPLPLGAPVLALRLRRHLTGTPPLGPDVDPALYARVYPVLCDALGKVGAKPDDDIHVLMRNIVSLLHDAGIPRERCEEVTPCLRQLVKDIRNGVYPLGPSAPSAPPAAPEITPTVASVAPPTPTPPPITQIPPNATEPAKRRVPHDREMSSVNVFIRVFGPPIMLGASIFFGVKLNIAVTVLLVLGGWFVFLFFLLTGGSSGGPYFGGGGGFPATQPIFKWRIFAFAHDAALVWWIIASLTFTALMVVFGR